MSTENFDILVEKFLDQTISSDEEAELLSLVNLDSALRAEFEDRLTQLSMLRRVYRKKISHSARVEIIKISKGVASIKGSPARDAKAENPRFFQWYVAAVAALIVCVLTLRTVWQTPQGTIAVGSNNAEILDLSDLVVESGQELKLEAERYLGRKILTRERSKAFIRYQDGTTIDLEENSLAKLSPAEAQKGKEIEVQSGRVAINAAPQPKDRPLKIQLPHGTVTVVGTLFSINVEPDGTSVELLKGTVQLTRKEDKASLQLTAGQRAVLAPGIVLAATAIQIEKVPLWTPAALSTAAWYDAADASTITHNNGMVSQWMDKSGNGRHSTQTMESQQPTVVASLLNGKSILRFDGDNDYLNSGGLGNVGDASIFAVLNRKSIQQGATLIGTDGAWRDGSFRIAGDSRSRYAYEAYSTGDSTSTRQATGVWTVIEFIETNGLVYFYNNGAPDGVANGSRRIVGKKTLDAFNIGSWNTSDYLEHDLAELIIIPSALSNEDRQKMEGYLAHKWSLAAELPVDHPYKSAEPTTAATKGERGRK